MKRKAVTAFVTMDIHSALVARARAERSTVERVVIKAIKAYLSSAPAPKSPQRL